MGIVKAAKLVYEYIRRDEEENIEEVKRAIDGVDVDIKKGDFVAVLGHNGSGKSTLAKHVNGLLLPTEGTVWVGDMDTRDDVAAHPRDAEEPLLRQTPCVVRIGGCGFRALPRQPALQLERERPELEHPDPIPDLQPQARAHQVVRGRSDDALPAPLQPRLHLL